MAAVDGGEPRRHTGPPYGFRRRSARSGGRGPPRPPDLPGTFDPLLLDDAIREVLSQEEEEFLAELDKDVGYGELVRGVFKGPMGWPNIVLMVFVLALLAVAAWTITEFLRADTAEEMLRWFGGAAASVGMVFMSRLWFGLTMQFNRTIREIKRVELRVAQLSSLVQEAGEGGGSAGSAGGAGGAGIDGSD